jgi:hypothetical protein
MGWVWQQQELSATAQATDTMRVVSFIYENGYVIPMSIQANLARIVNKNFEAQAHFAL